MRREHPLRMILDNAMITDTPPTDDQLRALTGDPDVQDQLRAHCAEIRELHRSGEHAHAERRATDIAEELEDAVSIELADPWAMPDPDQLCDEIRHRSHGRAADNTLTLPERRS